MFGSRTMWVLAKFSQDLLLELRLRIHDSEVLAAQARFVFDLPMQSCPMFLSYNAHSYTLKERHPRCCLLY